MSIFGMHWEIAPLEKQRLGFENRTMFGTSETSLSEISNEEHLRQSVRTILLTPIGSRVLVRDFGSDLYKYVDEPVNDATAMAVRVATVGALLKWEPRIAVDRVNVELGEGHIDVSIDAQILTTQEFIKLDQVRIER